MSRLLIFIQKLLFFFRLTIVNSKQVFGWFTTTVCTCIHQTIFNVCTSKRLVTVKCLYWPMYEMCIARIANLDDGGIAMQNGEGLLFGSNYTGIVLLLFIFIHLCWTPVVLKNIDLIIFSHDTVCQRAGQLSAIDEAPLIYTSLLSDTSCKICINLKFWLKGETLEESFAPTLYNTIPLIISNDEWASHISVLYILLRLTRWERKEPDIFILSVRVPYITIFWWHHILTTDFFFAFYRFHTH